MFNVTAKALVWSSMQCSWLEQFIFCVSSELLKTVFNILKGSPGKLNYRVCGFLGFWFVGCFIGVSLGVGCCFVCFVGGVLLLGLFLF